MKVPQSQSPSAPLRLWDVAAHWDVVARRSGAAGLRGCGASRPCDIGAVGLWDCGTVGLRGRGAAGHRGCGAWRPWAASEACGRVVVGVSARTHPRGAHGAVGLWGCGTVGLWDSAVGAFLDPSPRRRAKGAPRQVSWRGARVVGTSDAPRRTAPTRGAAARARVAM